MWHYSTSPQMCVGVLKSGRRHLEDSKSDIANTPEIMIDLLWTLMNIYHAINPSKSQRISYIPWNTIIRNNTIETTKQAPVRSESEMRDYIKSDLSSAILEFLEDLTYSLWLVRFAVRKLRHKLCRVWGHNIADSSIHIFINSVSSESLKLCLRLFF